MTSTRGPAVPKTATDYETGKAGKKWMLDQTFGKELD